MRGPLRTLVLAGATLCAPAAQAGDATAFVGIPSPTDVWGRSYGATLTSTWFKVVALEGEAARVRGEDPENGMTSFSASALLAPPVGMVTPFGGFAVGVFRQTSGDDSDTGLLKAFVLGAKVRIGIVVLRGEYRSLELPEDVMLPMDRRLSFGAGISF